jgi:hypothetical protein
MGEPLDDAAHHSVEALGSFRAHTLSRSVLRRASRHAPAPGSRTRVAGMGSARLRNRRSAAAWRALAQPDQPLTRSRSSGVLRRAGSALA